MFDSCDDEKTRRLAESLGIDLDELIEQAAKNVAFHSPNLQPDTTEESPEVIDALVQDDVDFFREHPEFDT